MPQYRRSIIHDCQLALPPHPCFGQRLSIARIRGRSPLMVSLSNHERTAVIEPYRPQLSPVCRQWTGFAVPHARPVRRFRSEVSGDYANRFTIHSAAGHPRNSHSRRTATREIQRRTNAHGISRTARPIRRVAAKPPTARSHSAVLGASHGARRAGRVPAPPERPRDLQPSLRSHLPLGRSTRTGTTATAS